MVSASMGTPYGFFSAAGSVAVWLAIGAATGWGNTWLISMSTGASIAAYLMVFVVQTSQNRVERESNFCTAQIETRVMNLEHQAASIQADTAAILDAVRTLLTR